MKEVKPIPASFRDPSGFLFMRGGELLRQVNEMYRADYDYLLTSGLYKFLIEKKLLIPHEEASFDAVRPLGAYKILRPEPVPFISYPYEWCFSQLKDAALATLAIQQYALQFGMALKDASAFNIQFVDGKPLLIDTLSFEIYKKGNPWNAYRQFCEHFLAPLALMSYTDVRLSQLTRVFMDGIPLNLAARLLPLRARVRPALFMHIALHARSQARFTDAHTNPEGGGSRFMDAGTMIRLAKSLQSAISRLHWRPRGTEWGEYYNDTNYGDAAFSQKEKLIERFLDQQKPGVVWDIGGNTGFFSRSASRRGIPTISFDIDPAAIEKNYREAVRKKEKTILPLVIDIMNPSGALGWRNRERDSLENRGPADMVFALALIHHLAISNNLPFLQIADFFADICRSLVIEFVPKHDSNAQRLLKSRKDIFPDYTEEHFEAAFKTRFAIRERMAIAGSERVLYYMQKH